MLDKLSAGTHFHTSTISLFHHPAEGVQTEASSIFQLNRLCGVLRAGSRAEAHEVVPPVTAEI